MIRYHRNRLAQLTAQANAAQANDTFRAYMDSQSTAPAPMVLGKPAPALPGRK